MNTRSTFALLLVLVCAHGSLGLAGSLADVAIERPAPTRVVVRWAGADSVDVYLASTADASLAKAALVSESDRDGHHELTIAPGQRPYLLLRDRSNGAITRVAERVLPLEQGSNFRDLGGYRSADGKLVRWGLIYRAGATPLLSDSDRGQINELGLRRMIDLRSSEERALAPTSIEHVEYVAVGYSMASMPGSSLRENGTPDAAAVYRGFPAMFAPHARIVFTSLLLNEGPILFNCSAGQDRTGFMSALVLTALGVPRDLIYQDYHLSTRFRNPEFEMPPIDVIAQAGNPVAMLFAKSQNGGSYSKAQPLYNADGKPLLALSFEEIDARWGSVDGYLASEIGLSAADIRRLRSLYLD